MKKATILMLTIALSSPVFAAEKFGHVNFHSSVLPEQKEALKKDFIYLFTRENKEADQGFLSLTKLPNASGPQIYNYAVNRVKFIMGESTDMNQMATMVGGYTFPKSPLSKLWPEPTKAPEPTGSMVIMSNQGAALYYYGKSNQLMFQVDFDGRKINITSPRIGLTQIGQGLFHPDKSINRVLHSEANTISRLGTILHEGRHSDGNGKSTGFLHMYCPEGHSMARRGACDYMANGPYTMGALTMRQLLKNCVKCSEVDKGAISAKILDSFNRVMGPNPQAKFIAVQKKINAHQKIISEYRRNTTADQAKVAEEIAKLERELDVMKKEIAALRLKNTPAEAWSDLPEGDHKTYPLAETTAEMAKLVRP